MCPFSCVRSTTLSFSSQPLNLPFIILMEVLVTLDPSPPVKPVLPNSACTVSWETLPWLLEPIIVSTGHRRWPSSDCGQHQQAPADPRQTGAQADGLCIFLFGCSGVSLDKGTPPSVPSHSPSTFFPLVTFFDCLIPEVEVLTRWLPSTLLWEWSQIEKVGRIYSEHPCTHLDSTINILLYLLCHTHQLIFCHLPLLWLSSSVYVSFPSTGV